MKVLLPVIAFLFASLHFVRAEAPAPELAPKTNLRAALLSSAFTWENPGGPGCTLRFFPDGTVRCTRPWSARWVATGLRTVTLEKKGERGKATLTFTPDFTRFEVIHFDQSNIFQGKVVAPKRAIAKTAGK